MSSVPAITAALALCPNPEDRLLPSDLAVAVELADHARAAATVATANRAVTADPSGSAGVLASATSVEEFDAVLDRIVLARARRDALREAADGGLSTRLDQQVDSVLADLMPTIVARLSPIFDAAVETLTESAAALPEAAAAFNADKVLRSGAGTSWTNAWDAIGTIDTIGAVWSAPSDPERIPRDIAPLLPILAVDAAAPQLLSQFDKYLADEDQHPTTASLKRLNLHMSGQTHAEMSPWERPRTLVELVRQPWPGLTLKLAADRDDLRERSHRVATAFTVQRQVRPNRVTVR